LSERLICQALIAFRKDFKLGDGLLSKLAAKNEKKSLDLKLRICRGNRGEDIKAPLYQVHWDKGFFFNMSSINEYSSGEALYCFINEKLKNNDVYLPNFDHPQKLTRGWIHPFHVRNSSGQFVDFTLILEDLEDMDHKQFASWK
jgi:hypothetical protein